MKKIVTLLSFLLLASLVHAQLAVGTSSPDATARFQIDAASTGNSKGFLPPRVALSAINSNLPFSVTPATGIMVYNTATSGTSPNNVTPGFYYFDGIRWQRLINTQDATIEFDTADPNTGTPNFTGGPAASANYIYISTVDNSQWTWDGSAYVTYVPPASTAWFTSGGTDAGSSKTSNIYRSGKVGIGNTAPNAALDIRTSPTSTSDPGAGLLGVGTSTADPGPAGAGAVRYNTGSGGILQYSNGTAWNTLQSNVQKVVVTGYFTGTYSASLSAQNLATIETSDASNAFTSDVFTAPRTGLYLVTANLLTLLKSWSAEEELTFGFSVAGAVVVNSAYISQSTRANGYGGPNLAAVISLTAGQTARFTCFAPSSGFTTNADIYNRFSITEL